MRVTDSFEEMTAITSHAPHRRWEVVCINKLREPLGLGGTIWG